MEALGAAVVEGFPHQRDDGQAFEVSLWSGLPGLGRPGHGGMRAIDSHACTALEWNKLALFSLRGVSS